MNRWTEGEYEMTKLDGLKARAEVSEGGLSEGYSKTR